MAISSQDDEQMIADINLTPLVDVSLVLVIIFMVVAPILNHVFKPLTLPTSARAGLTEQNTIRISIFPDGTLALGSAVIAPNTFQAKLRSEISSGKPPWVLVRAGADVSHGRVMGVMKILKETGIQRIAFATQPQAGSLPIPEAPQDATRQPSKNTQVATQ
ncbi:MAG: biopolymer transporter ExbD [Elusimicrobia bacterium]|nr:biopolymer transporter ExbD [Elusimicrobiota bacterium]